MGGEAAARAWGIKAEKLKAESRKRKPDRRLKSGKQIAACLKAEKQKAESRNRIAAS